MSAHGASAPGVRISDKPVVRVNGTALTDRDLLREMYAIFPYAQQHNGFPRELEPEIRRGALEMIIFDELVYQEAKRRHVTISPGRLARAEAEFRKQFPNQDVYEQFLRVEANGSRQVLRERIRRSLLIEALLRTAVDSKSAVSVAEAKAYYEKNSKSFEHGDRFSLQTISIIPPPNASAEIQKEARKRAEDAFRRAKATRSYQEFGLLAEKISDDDWRVNMGDRKQVERAQLPPPLVAAALKLKPGEVSDLLQLGPNYTLFRLNAYIPAGKTDFNAVKAQIQSDLQKARTNALRSELHKRLRKNAKVEVL
ncbi:MAG: peptidylprolyl isomerase [Acidobacteria bacterium]|nr:peptidylprolyl isomerase [Acidobacteriota bacterium]